MNSRKFIDFMRSPTGKAFLFLLVVAILYTIFVEDKPQRKKSKTITIPTTAEKKQFKGNSVEFRGAAMKNDIEINNTSSHRIIATKKPVPVPKVTSTASKATKTLSKPVTKVEKKVIPLITPIDLYANRSRVKNKFVSDEYAPYGRLIKCELVNTIDTANITTPVIALVSEDVEHNGKIIIPANTELHGLAAKSAIRDRVGTQNSWRFVWRTLDSNNGKELAVKGTALADTKSPDGDYWAITDGSAGIPGIIIDNRDEQLLKALAAIAIKGAGEGLKNQTTTTVGDNAIATSYDDTLNAILGNMAEESGQFIAKQILDSIEKQGYYVRCKAGTTFYLYVMQTIDLKDATIGGK